MSGELVTVPDAARDPALTPTQRFEMIARTARGMEQYNAPRETGERRVKSPAVIQSLAVMESAQYVERLTDRDGMISYHAFPKNLASGYTLPAMPAARVMPGEMYKNLSVFRAVGLTQDTVDRLVLEYARQWPHA